MTITEIVSQFTEELAKKGIVDDFFIEVSPHTFNVLAGDLGFVPARRAAHRSQLIVNTPTGSVVFVPDRFTDAIVMMNTMKHPHDSEGGDT